MGNSLGAEPQQACTRVGGMNWWQGRLCALDLETTGLDVEEARIVTATVAAVGGGTATEIDLTILDREARRHCAEDKSERVDWSGLTVIDPLVLDKHLDPYRKGSRRLEAACEHYRCRLDGAHDSAHDALAAARVAYRIGQTTELGHMTAPGLHDAQIEWAAEQARSLRDYFRQQGKTEAAASIVEDWPVCPLP
jgi:DNA polymerase III epsilon subunit-like protein